MAERLFFALWPGDEQRRALARLQRELAPRHSRATHADDLHITLVFLGDVTPEQRACAESAADRVNGRAFELMLDRVGCFPRARVTWCGPSAVTKPLLDLVEALNRELLGCGVRPERRPYSPHATLARKARPIDGRDLERPILWPVDGFSLVASADRPPPHYQVLRRWPLA